MILNKFGLKKSYTVEVVPQNSAIQTTWQFPDIPFLRDKYITGISLSTNYYGINSSRVNLGYAIPLDTFSTFLTLVDNKGLQIIQNMPLDELPTTSFQQNNNATVTSNFLSSYSTNGGVFFRPVNIVWTKCFIYMPVALGTAIPVSIGTAIVSCQFTIFYQDQK